MPRGAQCDDESPGKTPFCTSQIYIHCMNRIDKSQCLAKKGVPCQAKKQLGRQEWLSMETAGHMPRPRSMLLLLATPVPCALLFTRAASACAAHCPTSAQ